VFLAALTTFREDQGKRFAKVCFVIFGARPSDGGDLVNGDGRTADSAGVVGE
jgi:hypothetical protein